MPLGIYLTNFGTIVILLLALGQFRYILEFVVQPQSLSPIYLSIYLHSWISDQQTKSAYVLTVASQN